MSFDYDPTNPLDDSLVASFPANERDSRAAIMDSVDTEHDSGTGQHNFVITDTATLTTMIGASQTGRLVLVNDTVATYLAAYIKSGGGFSMIVPGPPWTRTNANQSWTSSQYGTRTVLNPASWDLSTANFFTYTLSGNITITNPSDSLGTNVMGSWVIQLLQDGTGSRTVGFGTAFLPAFGTQPDVDSAPNSYTLIYITRLAKAAPNLSYSVVRCA